MDLATGVAHFYGATGNLWMRRGGGGDRSKRAGRGKKEIRALSAVLPELIIVPIEARN